jgi:hypothetical protein
VDPTRRRFLTVAAVGSLAAAALTPNDVPQAVTTPTGSPSPELRAAIRVLAKAHEALIAAKANNDEAPGLTCRAAFPCLPGRSGGLFF